MMAQERASPSKPYYVNQANEREIPLLHEHNGSIKEGTAPIEVGCKFMSLNF